MIWLFNISARTFILYVWNLHLYILKILRVTMASVTTLLYSVRLSNIFKNYNFSSDYSMIDNSSELAQWTNEIYISNLPTIYVESIRWTESMLLFNKECIRHFNRWCKTNCNWKIRNLHAVRGTFMHSKYCTWNQYSNFSLYTSLPWKMGSHSVSLNYLPLPTPKWFNLLSINDEG